MDLGKLYEDLGFVLLYLAIAIVGVAIVTGVAVYIFKREKFKDFIKYAVGIATGFAVCALTLMTYLKAQCNKIDGTVMDNMLFIPIIVEIALAVAGMVAMLICSLFNKKAFKIAGLATAVCLLGGFIAIMVEMAKYYKTVQTDYDANLTGLIVSAIVFILLIGVIYFLGDKRKINDTRSIVYGAVAIAMSFALSYIRIFEMPQGGSLTLASLLPLMIYCCMFGTRRGTIACLIYGVLQAVQDPWIIHPMQFLLDYPLAFGMVGISGIFIEKKVFKNKKILGFLLGGIVAVTGRFICHVLSGVFAFSVWANLEKYSTVLAYSMAYNSFAFIDMVIALAAGSMLFMSKAFTAQMEKSSDIGEEKKESVLETAYEDDDDDFVYPDDIKNTESNASGEMTFYENNDVE
ncbi:MAG: energy-coupled thiamine transporter ThiT [Clostridia bacterium]|nr:energy-coupled thiamine transporter ThiT [Clostridia bacterium]